MLVVVAAALPASALAFNTLDGDRTAWQINPTYTLVNGSSDVADGSDEAAIRRSFATWQNVADADISFREVARGGDITVEFLARWPREYGADAAGVTLTQRDRGVITSAEVSINEQNFDWATDGDPNSTDIEGVVTHEVGHGLGLGHSRSRTATMVAQRRSRRRISSVGRGVARTGAGGVVAGFVVFGFFSVAFVFAAFAVSAGGVSGLFGFGGGARSRP
jgi:hypothetical protein